MLKETTRLINALRGLLETLTRCDPVPTIALLLCITLFLMVAKS